MKKYLFILLFVLPIALCAQTKKNGGAKRSANVKGKKETTINKTNPVYDTSTFVFCRGYKFLTNLTNEHIAYTVVQASGYSQSELYKKMLVGISKLYKNPDEVITKVDNEMLTINGVEMNCVRENGYDYSFKYNIQILFKDGKIRIDAPTITAWSLEDKDFHNGTPARSKYETIKPQHEKWMNNTIAAFFKSSFGATNEDW